MEYNPEKHQYDNENQNTMKTENVIIFNGDYRHSERIKQRLKKLNNSHFYELAVKVAI